MFRAFTGLYSLELESLLSLSGLSFRVGKSGVEDAMHPI